ncbi:DUF1905 domain-containing protein [Actinotalea ferrariae]|uniref:YdeI/OmpD-associated family protein n=1 Tax=Actinotalea ferrariae TaxID=1386098 RepID=UPI001C8C3E0A|nr:YdeI/OmpD-associated family protein [Actinotalea ferrariae]MBX9245354.1 DUF1905 domain-containing protein [Actinotalea ferrariae]
MRYRTTILRGKTGTTTGIEVPPEVLAALGQGRKPPVVVTVGGHTYRSTVATMGGVSMISLSSANRAAAGVEGGQEVEVEVELDTAPRTVDVPEDLAAALADGSAREAFDRLSYSARKAHVLAVEDARTPETRQRRIAGVVTKLTA